MKAPETGRILIVDDDPIVIRVLASALAHYSTLMLSPPETLKVQALIVNYNSLRIQLMER